MSETVVTLLRQFKKLSAREISKLLALIQRQQVSFTEYNHFVSKYTFTSYFENDVLTKRPYLKKEWCIYVVENPIRCEPQENNRFRFWAQIKEFGDRYLRVITLEDKLTIHNAFPDRSFRP